MGNPSRATDPSCAARPRRERSRPPGLVQGPSSPQERRGCGPACRARPQQSTVLQRVKGAGPCPETENFGAPPLRVYSWTARGLRCQPAPPPWPPTLPGGKAPCSGRHSCRRRHCVRLTSARPLLHKPSACLLLWQRQRTDHGSPDPTPCKQLAGWMLVSTISLSMLDAICRRSLRLPRASGSSALLRVHLFPINSI
ncbi:hypothetical protein NDU88_002764 [Pleurodeles waltl]|uniref:Uncharacterized protein n=1 Tax=Pleurodeles waltl TaxID=8319 RepID=A0AAV7M206_PLEWA|nr:hypothetical protein NDU88_002764 [Pleurodeles waltl]